MSLYAIAGIFFNSDANCDQPKALIRTSCLCSPGSLLSLGGDRMIVILEQRPAMVRSFVQIYDDPRAA